MKRTRTTTLVSYGESSDSENERHPPNERPKPPSPAAPPPPKKRKLPALPACLTPAVPLDDPSKHQGRTRTTPHVDGQWAAYVYVPLALRGALRRVVARAMDIASGEMATSTSANLHVLGAEDFGEHGAGTVADVRELHVSLTRPFFLCASQREDMKRAVRDVAKAHSPFVASFAAFSNLTNDECTRTFICMEVGAGHQELRALSDALTPALQSFRQKEYYEQPRFHASFAWALLDRPAQNSTSQSPEPLESLSYTTFMGNPTSENPKSFPAVPRLPENIVPTLNAQLSSQLKGSAGTFDIGEVRIRIGKDVFSWGLSG